MPYNIGNTWQLVVTYCKPSQCDGHGRRLVLLDILLYSHHDVPSPKGSRHKASARGTNAVDRHCPATRKHIRSSNRPSLKVHVLDTFFHIPPGKCLPLQALPCWPGPHSAESPRRVTEEDEEDGWGHGARRSATMAQHVCSRFEQPRLESENTLSSNPAERRPQARHHKRWARPPAAGAAAHSSI